MTARDYYAIKRAEQNKCPNGCGRQVKPGRFLCYPCWSLVPKQQQLEVYRTWRVYKEARASRVPGAGAEAFEEYMAAREAALEAISS